MFVFVVVEISQVAIDAVLLGLGQGRLPVGVEEVGAPRLVVHRFPHDGQVEDGLRVAAEAVGEGLAAIAADREKGWLVGFDALHVHLPCLKRDPFLNDFEMQGKTNLEVRTRQVQGFFAFTAGLRCQSEVGEEVNVAAEVIVTNPSTGSMNYLKWVYKKSTNK